MQVRLKSFRDILNFFLGPVFSAFDAFEMHVSISYPGSLKHIYHYKEGYTKVLGPVWSGAVLFQGSS